MSDSTEPTAPDGQVIERFARKYPPADITPVEYEHFVVELLEGASPDVENLRVALHEMIEGTDGSYDFDATVRFQLMGLDFLVLVEAKRHVNPIKRELVQALHSKLQSVGANKAVMFSTAPYQRGALDFAKTHGVALVVVTESRYTMETRSAEEHPVLTRDQARDLYGMSTYSGMAFGAGDSPGSTRITTLSVDTLRYVAEELLGVDPK